MVPTRADKLQQAVLCNFEGLDFRAYLLGFRLHQRPDYVPATSYFYINANKPATQGHRTKRFCVNDLNSVRARITAKVCQGTLKIPLPMSYSLMVPKNIPTVGRLSDNYAVTKFPRIVVDFEWHPLER